MQLWPTYENFTQPPIVVEEVGAIAKPMPLHDSCVIALRPLLEVEHCGAQRVLCEARSLNTDKENIPALRQQLA